MGGANAPNGLCHSPIEQDTRGSEISEGLSLSNLVFVNENCPTRLPFSDNRPSSPHITAITDDIALLTSWHTINNRMSDHLLLLVTVETNDVRVGVKHQHNCIRNMRKAVEERSKKNWTMQFRHSWSRPPPKKARNTSSIVIRRVSLGGEVFSTVRGLWGPTKSRVQKDPSFLKTPKYPARNKKTPLLGHPTDKILWYLFSRGG